MIMGAERVILMALIATTLFNNTSSISGSATYNSDIVYPTACGYGPEQGTMVAWISVQVWDRDRSDCGKFYRVRCTGRTGVQQPCKNGEITVKVIGFCPGCSRNQIELSEQAFSMISDPSYGKIDIEYYPSKIKIIENLRLD